MLVDDSPGECQLFQLALSQIRPDVALFMRHDADQALRFIFQHSAVEPLPNAIFLDWRLGKSNGNEFLTRLRTNIRRAVTPVVVFTTSDDLSDISTSYASGANSYVVKPDTFEGLVAFAKEFCAFWLAWNRSMS